MFRSYCSLFFSPGSANFLAERAQSSEIVTFNSFGINCNILLIFKEDSKYSIKTLPKLLRTQALTALNKSTIKRNTQPLLKPGNLFHIKQSILTLQLSNGKKYRNQQKQIHVGLFSSVDLVSRFGVKFDWLGLVWLARFGLEGFVQQS